MNETTETTETTVDGESPEPVELTEPTNEPVATPETESETDPLSPAAQTDQPAVPRVVETVVTENVLTIEGLTPRQQAGCVEFLQARASEEGHSTERRVSGMLAFAGQIFEIPDMGLRVKEVSHEDQAAFVEFVKSICADSRPVDQKLSGILGKVREIFPELLA